MSWQDIRVGGSDWIGLVWLGLVGIGWLAGSVGRMLTST